MVLTTAPTWMGGRWPIWSCWMILLLLLFLGSSTSAAAMTWQSVASLPAPGRHHPITFANETHGFLLTGTTALNSVTNDMYLYDPSTDTWTTLWLTNNNNDNDNATDVGVVLPVARSYSYGVVLPQSGDTKAYLGFGSSLDSQILADWWEFDMSTLQWKQLADFPGDARRHPAMNVVLQQMTNAASGSTTTATSSDWEIQVGLGDGVNGNFNDWWVYSIASDTWRQLPDFPGSQRHHPFYFGIGTTSYAGLGHADGIIERDWYSIENEVWTRLPDFSSTSSVEDAATTTPITTVVTTEARVAGTQFSITMNNKSLGFALSGDGDDHRSMLTGEFHAFLPELGEWKALPPHPGQSRWAPGSFVLRGTTQVYFVGGYDRSTGILHNDMWKIDVQDLFVEPAAEEEDGNDGNGTTTSNGTSTSPPDDQDPTVSNVDSSSTSPSAMVVSKWKTAIGAGWMALLLIVLG